MALTGSESYFSVNSFSMSIEEEFLLNKIVLTHNPDGRYLDSELLLQSMEIVMSYASNSQVSHLPKVDATAIPNIEVFGSEETLGHIIYTISCAIPQECCKDGEMHTKTMALLEMLGHYRWDAKVAIILAAFAISYGKFQLILQLNGQNPLAASIALLKHLPCENLITSNLWFNALALLVNEMLELAKCIIKFEGLPLQHVLLDDSVKSVAKSHIYLAAYWIFRSSLACSSQIIGFKYEQHSNSTANAAWGLSSLVFRLSSLCSCLRRQVDECQKQIEKRLHMKLTDLLKDHTQADNQEVLHLLLSLKDDLPLKDCSSQVGISELKNKVVVLVVSKPELFPIEKTLFLVQQTHDHPHHKQIEQSYQIVWIPISFSNKWTPDEERSFEYLSSSLPWLSIRQPWLLNSAVISFIKENWNFLEEPLMVVLDSQGMVIHSNAIDMVLIWGARAFPFSNSREKELWEEENWNVQVLVDGLDPFLMEMVEEGRNICICGSDSLEWIRAFHSRMKEMKNAGLQLQVIYVGKRNSSKSMQNISTIIDKEHSLTLTKIQFFWLRLESMRKSILRLGQNIANFDCFFFLNEISKLLDIDNDDEHENWAVFGSGNSRNILKLQGRKIMECFDQFPEWGENVERFGLVDAMRNASETLPLVSIPCNHSKILPFNEGMIEGTVICDKCKRPMEQFVVYGCEVSE